MDTDKLLANARARRTLREVPELARSLRLQSSLTLHEIGDALGVTYAAVQRWETGQRVPRGDTARRYLELLHKAAST
ncbi:MAG: helix-turn-helix domain-containing protein [Thermoanaerobaculia bacterium]